MRTESGLTASPLTTYGRQDDDDQRRIWCDSALTAACGSGLAVMRSEDRDQ